MPEANNYDHDAFNQYINAEVLLHVGDLLFTGKVIACKKDHDSNPVGHFNVNPILDSCVLEVQFNKGVVKEFAANIIAKHIYSQVDNEGRCHPILDEIIDHRKDGSAIAPYNLYVINHNGNQHMQCTTKGWKQSIQWKVGSVSWLPLKDLKESDPVKVAEYAVANKLVHKPAFAWWVPHTLCKQDNIVSAVKTCYQKKTHKFGIRIPKTVLEALEIDRDTYTCCRPTQSKRR